MTRIFAALLAVIPPSASCTACHDDTWAITMDSSHPFAIAYAPVAAAKPDRYRPPSSVQDILRDGNVECASCHVPHEEKTSNQFRLRTRDIVKLCTTCHILGE